MLDDVADQLPLLVTHIDYEVTESTIEGGVRMVRQLVVHAVTRPHRCAEPCAERYYSIEPYVIE